MIYFVITIQFSFLENVKDYIWQARIKHTPHINGKNEHTNCHHNLSLNPFIPLVPPPAEYRKYIETPINEHPKRYSRTG